MKKGYSIRWLVAVAILQLVLPSGLAGQAAPSLKILATLHEPTPTMSGAFGSSVSIGEGFLLVGAYGATVGGKKFAGAAYLFDLGGALLSTLTSISPKSGSQFAGQAWTNGACAMSGTTAIVGEGISTGGGRAFVFLPDGTRMTIASPITRPNVQFGCSVCGDEGAVLVGAYDAGAWLFDSHGACVAQFSPKRAIAKSYGMAVALKGNVAVVTQDHAFVGDVDDAGMAFLFDRSGKPIAEMQAPTPEKGSVFGVCAATDGNVIAIGAPYASSGGATKAGAVYLYSASDGAWLRTLSAPAPVQGGYFGLSVAIDGGRIVAGAPGTAVSGVSGAGICFLFDSAGRPIGELVDPEPTPYGNFGWAVSMRGKLLLVGAKAAKVGNQDGAGKAILFEILGD